MDWRGCRPPALRRLAILLWDSLSDTPVRGSIKTLAVAKSGGLSVGSANPASVGRIRDGKLQRYDTGLEGLEAVTAVVEDGRGTIWAIVDWDLYRWDENSWHRVTLPWKSRVGQVRHVFVSRTGTLWVGTGWGVFEQIAGATGFRIVSDEHVWGIDEDSKGHIWTTDIAAGFRQLGAAQSTDARTRSGRLSPDARPAGCALGWHVRRRSVACSIGR